MRDGRASLMCETSAELLAHAQVLVIAHTDTDVREALAAVRPGQIVIDIDRDCWRP